MSSRVVGVNRIRPRSVMRAWVMGPLLVPFLFALFLRMGLSILVPVRPVWDGVIYARSADFIAHGRGFTRTAIDPREPAEATAFYPVGFPAMLAPLRWFGGRNLDLAAQSCAGALLVVIAGLIGRRAAGPRIGRRAAWLVALWPGGVLLSASWMSEPFFSLFVGAASLVAVYTRRRKTLASSVLISVILGLGALVRPTAIPMLIAYVAGLAFYQTLREPRLLRRSYVLAMHLAIMWTFAFVMMLPWSIRNAISLDATTLVSTNGGANLLVGTSNEGSFARIPEELDCSSALPEVARDRCRAEVAFDRIRNAPLAWLARGVLKLVHTFGHESAPAQAWGRAIVVDDATRETMSLWALAIDRAWWLVFLSASIAGAVVLIQRRAMSSLHVALFAPIAALAVLHFVTLGGDRYHAPVVVPMAVLAALSVRAVALRGTV